MKKRTLLGLLAVLPMSLLTACGGGDDGSDASVRLINASPGYASLDLYVEDNKEVSAVTFGVASDFSNVSNGDVTTALTVTGSSTELLTQSRSFASGKSYSVVAYGWDGALKSVVIPEDEDEADAGETSFSVLNTASDAGSLDVYLTADSDSLDSSTAVRSGVEGGTRSAFSTVTAGTYRLRVTANGDTSDVRLDVTGLVLPSKGVMTLILTPTKGGLLVNGLTLQQKGGLTKQLTTKARARVVANVASGAAVTMSAGDVSLSSASKSPAIKDYVLIDAGTVALNTSVDGTLLATQSLTVAAGSDVTFLVTGATPASAAVKVIQDDNRLPIQTTKYKIRLIHGSNLLAGEALTLSIDLSDVVSDQEFATSSDFEDRTASSSSDLSVSSLSATTPVFTVEDQALLAKGVYTMFVYDTAAGVATGKLKRER
ncbi:DUF4397 domain-containing protein [Ideonella sp.]|uniref:DUF4397 domain-containing protein n=1 Tax=Ideonella sp. TaxID=1929293 RepID=UPI003BB5CCAF